jgi:hypothetical protein
MLTKADLTNLIDATLAPGVSLFLPTHTLGRETRQNPIILKNLLALAREKLEALDLSATRIEALLAPAADLLEDFDYWQHQDQGLALFLSGSGMQAFQLPATVDELAVVGPDFHIVPLLPLQEQDADFVILAMTADDTRAFQGTRFSITSMQIADMPASVEALNGIPDYEGSLQSGGYGRPNTGGKNMPKTQVYGDSPEEWRKGRLVEFVRRTAAALAANLARHPVGVVVIADAEIGGQLMKAEALKSLIVGSVEVNPASMDDAGLHVAALAVMQPIHGAALAEALDTLEALSGRNDATACTDPVGLLSAAHHGRVDLLFLPEDAALAGRFDDETAVATLGEGPEAEMRDLSNIAARLTLLNGGRVRVLAQDRLPEGVTMAAILRY